MKTKDFSVLNIPFNSLIRLEKSDKSPYLFKIHQHQGVLNHLDTFHAGVLFSLAESTSGQYLSEEYGPTDKEIIPVIRKAEIKYSRPGNGTVYSSATILEPTIEEIREQLNTRGRVLVKVRSEVFDEQDRRLLTAVFDWFVTCL